MLSKNEQKIVKKMRSKKYEKNNSKNCVIFLRKKYVFFHRGKIIKNIDVINKNENGTFFKKYPPKKLQKNFIVFSKVFIYIFSRNIGNNIDDI